MSLQSAEERRMVPFEAPYDNSLPSSPGRAVVGCECGERPTLTLSRCVCRCGADHTAVVRKELATLCGWEKRLSTLDATPSSAKKPAYLFRPGRRALKRARHSRRRLDCGKSGGYATPELRRRGLPSGSGLRTKTGTGQR